MDPRFIIPSIYGPSVYGKPVPLKYGKLATKCRGLSARDASRVSV